MHDEQHAYGHHEESDPSSVQQGYELTDLQLRAVMWSGVVIVILTFLAYVVSTFVVRYANAQPEISDFDAPPIALEAGNQAFAPGVRLQVAPEDALKEMHVKQHKEATTFGVVSAEPEIYRIPVDTAMDIVANRGLPAFKLPESADDSAGAANQAGPQ